MNIFSSQVLNTFLDAIIDDKIEISNLLSKSTLSKFENSFLSYGRSYCEINGVPNFDKEIEELLDEKTKNLIKVTVKGKLLKLFE